ncbi:MAG: FAD binding domain-containing protein [Streptosporangiaceae bacterium]
MRSFAYLESASLDEALSQLAEYGEDARPIAGGQSLLLEMKDRARAPRYLISLAGLSELHGLSSRGARLAVGATTSYRELGDSPPAGPYFGLGRVAADIADLPVRSMATVGGAICQADPRFDLPVVTTALGAEFLLRSQSGDRLVPAHEFFAGQGTTVMRPDELLTSLVFPERAADFWWAFRKFRMRSMDAAQASVAVAGRKDAAGALHNPVVVVGACTGSPTRFTQIEQLLDGAPPGAELYTEAANLLATLADLPARPWPFLEPGYLRHTCGVLLRRALSDTNGYGDGNGTSLSGGR